MEKFQDGKLQDFGDQHKEQNVYEERLYTSRIATHESRIESRISI